MKDRPIADWRLERYLIGELPPKEAEKIRRRLEADETAAHRLAGLEESNREILRSYTPQEMAARITRRMEGRRTEERRSIRSRTVRMTAYSLPAAAAIALLITLSPMKEWISGSGVGVESIRQKGLETGLAVYRKTTAGTEKLADGDTASAHDVVQLAYLAGEARYGAILSIDGRGMVTWHLPESSSPADEAPPLEIGGEVPLSFSYILDDAPDFERFFFVYSGSSFPLSSIADRAARLAARPDRAHAKPMDLGRRIDQVSIILNKGEGR